MMKLVIMRLNQWLYINLKAKNIYNVNHLVFGVDWLKTENWTIIEEKEGKFIQKEKANDDDILGDNPIFIKNNMIISWNFNGKIIKFLSY